MLDLNWDGWTSDGTIDANRFAIVAETDRFDHCVFTVRHDLDRRLGAALARRAVRDAVRQSRAPGNDGPRRAQGVVAGPDERLRGADRGRRVERTSSNRLQFVSELPLFPVTTVGQLAEAAEGRRGAAPVSPEAHRPRRVRSDRRRRGGRACCDCRTPSAATSSPTVSCGATTSTRSSPRSWRAFG